MHLTLASNGVKTLIIGFDFQYSLEGHMLDKNLLSEIGQNPSSIIYYLGIDAQKLATLLLVCYFHKDPLISSQFLNKLQGVLRLRGINLVINYRDYLIKVLDVLQDVEQICDENLFIKDEFSEKDIGQFTLKSSDKNSMLAAAKQLHDELLATLLNIEINEFLSSIDPKLLLGFPRNELFEYLVDFFQQKIDAFNRLSNLAKADHRVAIFLMLNSSLFLSKLDKIRSLRFIFRLWSHYLSSKQENSIYLFESSAERLSMSFLLKNTFLYLKLIQSLVNNYENKEYQTNLILIKAFATKLFTRWLDLADEMEKLHIFYCSLLHTFDSIVFLFDKLPIFQAVALRLIQNKEFEHYPCHQSHLLELKSKLLGLQNPDDLLKLGNLVIDGKFPNLNRRAYGAPTLLVVSLLRSWQLASNEPQLYISLLLRPVTSSWFWLGKYFSNVSSEYEAILERYSIDGPVGQQQVLNTPSNKKVLAKRAGLSICHTLHVKKVKGDMAVHNNRDARKPFKRERSFSLDKALMQTRENAMLIAREKAFSEWLLSRSYFNLDEVGYKRLAEFKNLLQGKLTALLFGIQAINSGTVAIASDLNSSIADFLIAKLLALIPYAGPFLEIGWHFSEPVSALRTYLKKETFSKFISILNSLSNFERLTDKWSSLITAYHYAEIIDPSKNIAYFENIYKTYFQPQIFMLIKEGLSKQVEKHITGVDDKVKQDIKYKEHWDELTEYFLAKFISDVAEISFMESYENVNADILSARHTLVSNELRPFDFDNELFDINNAYSASQLATLAYERKSKIEKLAEYWGYPPESSGDIKSHFFISKADIQVLALADETKICISFRGTATTLNVCNHLEFGLEQIATIGNEEICVHKGFWKCIDRIWDELVIYLKNHINKLKEKGISLPCLLLTGHSLGGALATLSAYRFVFDHNFHSDIQLYTFGQPRCGNEAFATALNKNVPNYYRVINYLDLIVNLPPRLMNYTHAGKIIWLDSKGELLDKEAYRVKMNELDIYGKKQVRDNLIQRMRRMSDHSLSQYQLKIARKVHKEPNLYNVYSNYLNNEFSFFYTVKPHRDEPIMDLEEFNQSRHNFEKRWGKAKEKNNSLLEFQVKGDVTLEISDFRAANRELEDKVQHLQKELKKKSQVIDNLTERLIRLEEINELKLLPKNGL